MLRNTVNNSYTRLSTINLYFISFVKAHSRYKSTRFWLSLSKARSHLQVETSCMCECQQGYDAHIWATVSNFDHGWLGQPWTRRIQAKKAVVASCCSLTMKASQSGSRV